MSLGAQYQDPMALMFQSIPYIKSFPKAIPGMFYWNQGPKMECADPLGNALKSRCASYDLQSAVRHTAGARKRSGTPITTHEAQIMGGSINQHPPTALLGTPYAI